MRRYALYRVPVLVLVCVSIQAVITERTLSPGGFARIMGVFWMRGPGGSSLPSWTDQNKVRINYCAEIQRAVKPKQTWWCRVCVCFLVNVNVTLRSLGWYSRSRLGPDRFSPGGPTSLSPRRRLLLRPCPYIPGWLWPDSDIAALLSPHDDNNNNPTGVNRKLANDGKPVRAGDTEISSKQVI